MGKTGWMAAAAVEHLYTVPEASVIIASTSIRTAMHCYGRAVRIIELTEALRGNAIVYRNKADPYTELPARGAIMRPLPAEEKYIVGQTPSLVLIDEVGYVSPPTLEAMQTSLGKVPGAVMVAFGTPGLGVIGSDDLPNVMWQMRQLSLSEDPPEGLRYVEHAARATDDPGHKDTWKRAYAGLLGDLVDARAVANDYATMPPSRFGQMRLGLWTQHEDAWMTPDAWDSLELDEGPLGSGALITLGFDGSVRRDSTALVAYEPATGRLVVLGHWTGEVSRAEVMAAVDDAFTRYNVARMLADPWYWREALQELGERLGEELVLEYNTASIERMAPASDAFRTAVMLGQITWDGTQALRSHVLNAVAKRTPKGDIITRDARRPRDTDLAVASVLAYEASRTWEEVPAPVIY
jgi:phage terminase large subunit-like protein